MDFLDMSINELNVCQEIKVLFVIIFKWHTCCIIDSTFSVGSKKSILTTDRANFLDFSHIYNYILLTFIFCINNHIQPLNWQLCKHIYLFVYWCVKFWVERPFWSWRRLYKSLLRSFLNLIFYIIHVSDIFDSSHLMKVYFLSDFTW